MPAPIPWLHSCIAMTFFLLFTHQSTQIFESNDNNNNDVNKSGSFAGSMHHRSNGNNDDDDNDNLRGTSNNFTTAISIDKEINNEINNKDLSRNEGRFSGRRNIKRSLHCTAERTLEDKIARNALVLQGKVLRSHKRTFQGQTANNLLNLFRSNERENDAKLEAKDDLKSNVKDQEPETNSVTSGKGLVLDKSKRKRGQVGSPSNSKVASNESSDFDLRIAIYSVIFRVERVFKGAELLVPSPEQKVKCPDLISFNSTNRKNPKPFVQAEILMPSTSETFSDGCIADNFSITLGLQYFVFLDRHLAHLNFNDSTLGVENEAGIAESFRPGQEGAGAPCDTRSFVVDGLFRSFDLPRIFQSNMTGFVKSISCCAKLPSFQNRPYELVAYVNKKVQSMHCKVSGLPLPEVTWYKDSQPINDPIKRMKLSRNNTKLSIRRVKLRDQGWYWCQATNVLGSTNSSPTYLNVTSQQPENFSSPYHTAALCDAISDIGCMNQGTCYKIPTLELSFCVCKPGFVGDRCQEGRLEVREREGYTTYEKLAVAAVLISALVLVALSTIAYCLAKLREEYRSYIMEKVRLMNEVKSAEFLSYHDQQLQRYRHSRIQNGFGELDEQSSPRLVLQQQQQQQQLHHHQQQQQQQQQHQYKNVSPQRRKFDNLGRTDRSISKVQHNEDCLVIRNKYGTCPPPSSVERTRYRDQSVQTTEIGSGRGRLPATSSTPQATFSPPAQNPRKDSKNAPLKPPKMSIHQHSFDIGTADLHHSSGKSQTTQKNNSFVDGEKARSKANSSALDTSKPQNKNPNDEKNRMENFQSKMKLLHRQEDGKYLCERHRNVWKKVDHVDQGDLNSGKTEAAVGRSQKWSKKIDKELEDNSQPLEKCQENKKLNRTKLARRLRSVGIK